MTLREEITMLSEMPVKLETSGHMFVDFLCFRFLVNNIRKTLSAGIATPDNKEILNYILKADIVNGPIWNFKPSKNHDVSVKITDDYGHVKATTRFIGKDAENIIKTLSVKAGISKMLKFANSHKKKYPEEVDAAIRYLSFI